MEEKNKIYFASDFHLGAPSFKESTLREKKIVSWLDSIKKDATHLFLLGDIFDFWFEYEKVVPKGFIRFFGKLADLSDFGVEIHFFVTFWSSLRVKHLIDFVLDFCIDYAGFHFHIFDDVCDFFIP